MVSQLPDPRSKRSNCVEVCRPLLRASCREHVGRAAVDCKEHCCGFILLCGEVAIVQLQHWQHVVDGVPVAVLMGCIPTSASGAHLAPGLRWKMCQLMPGDLLCCGLVRLLRRLGERLVLPNCFWTWLRDVFSRRWGLNFHWRNCHVLWPCERRRANMTRSTAVHQDVLLARAAFEHNWQKPQAPHTHKRHISTCCVQRRRLVGEADPVAIVRQGCDRQDGRVHVHDLELHRGNPRDARHCQLHLRCAEVVQRFAAGCSQDNRLLLRHATHLVHVILLADLLDEKDPSEALVCTNSSNSSNRTHRTSRRRSSASRWRWRWPWRCLWLAGIGRVPPSSFCFWFPPAVCTRCCFPAITRIHRLLGAILLALLLAFAFAFLALLGLALATALVLMLALGAAATVSGEVALLATVVALSVLPHLLATGRGQRINLHRRSS